MERTFVMVKPDGVQRGLIGEILGRLERRGLKVVGLKLLQVSDELARRHYAVHEGKPFFAGLIRYIVAAGRPMEIGYSAGPFGQRLGGDCSALADPETRPAGSG